MSASIRGHQASFKVMVDGSPLEIDTITNFSINLDSSMTRSFYVGKAIGEGDQSIEGWSGSFEMEVKDDKVEKFIDALVTDNLNGIGVKDYVFLSTENYPDGTTSTYVYFDSQFTYGRSSGGMGEKVKKTINFQASGRQLVP